MPIAPMEELKRLGLSHDAVDWLVDVEQRLTDAEDLLRLNHGILMPISTVPISTGYIAGTSGSEQTILTAEADTATMLTRIVVCNTDASAVTFSAWLVPDGGVVGDQYLVVDALSIAAHDTVLPDALKGQPIAVGAALIVAAGSASKLTLSGSYTRRTRSQ